MSKRLQVVLNDSEAREIKRLARLQRITVSEWVRHALRSARQQVPRSGAEKKLQIVRAAAGHSYPSGEMNQILREIEQGYLNQS